MQNSIAGSEIAGPSGVDGVPNICVVHLIRKNNGIEPFRQFLTSYLKHRAGVEHDLLIVYKGFYKKSDMASYEQLLKDVPHSYMQIADFGFDLRAYFLAAEKFNYNYFCFLNSFSIILDHEWLLKLYRHITQPDVGMAGATGCWGSVIIGRQSTQKNNPLLKKIIRRLVWRIIRAYQRHYFHVFPNPYLRTNAFMMSRDNMLKIKKGIILTKTYTHKLESGKQGFTRQVIKMGLKPVVVGRNGIGYEIRDWFSSNTFWHGKQDNLLVSDNKTRLYSDDNSDLKKTLETFAWGGAVDKTQAENRSALDIDAIETP